MRLLRNIVTIAILLVPTAVFAQTAGQEPLRYVVSPETPGPYERVLIQIEGVGNFLGDATITWRQDGAVVNQGAGEHSYSFMTGALGSRTTIGATVVSPAEGTFSRTFVFSPSVVTMVWESDTTAPPLYRGKTLYSAGSQLKVLAFPTVFSGGSRITTGSLSYQWRRNDEAVTEVSGLGRSIFTFTGDQLKDGETVAVDVYAGSVKVGHGEITIPVTQPRVILYQYNALRGPLYDMALPAAISLGSKEITIKAEPYFFARESKQNNTLAYDWQLNGESVSGPDTTRGILTLRQAGAGAGEASLSVSLQNLDSSKLVQAAEAALGLVFGESGSALGNLFGL